jgi:glycine/D-amino acid oxidase-like deaminating enzyme
MTACSPPTPASSGTVAATWWSSGGGITGALVAHRFVREGIRVVLVEGREIGFGSTGATTALIQYEIDRHLCELIDRVGEAHAVRSYELCQDAVRGIERLATEDGDNCGYKLIAAAAQLGLEVHDRTVVSTIDPHKAGVQIRTAEGYRIQAKKVVFATGYETPKYLDQKIVKLSSTFALATAPLQSFEGWGEDCCLIWETARPYFYARTTQDGRAILGGADKPFATAHKQEKLIQAQTAKLSTQFARLFPSMPVEVDWIWGGTFGETRDGLPYIGTVPQFPHGYFALGYGGNGITFSYIAAELLVDLFLGRRNPDLAIFRFDR